MTKGRQVPPPHHRATAYERQRRAALASGDPVQVRTWARAWSVPLIPCDDALLMASIRAANEVDATMQPHVDSSDKTAHPSE